MTRASTPAPTSLRLEILEGTDAERTISLASLEDVRAVALIEESPPCETHSTSSPLGRRPAAFDLDEAKVRLTDLDSPSGVIGEHISVDTSSEAGAPAHGGDSAFRVKVVEPIPAHVAELPSATHFGKYIGSSPQMRRLYDLCDRIASSNVPAIIEGETGTGKEVLAEALHAASPRANGPFVVFDCTAVPANLVESELFGYERGAFTGAAVARKGMLEQAAGGTLFIDEIGDLDIALQPKLLRAVERHEMRRLGGDRTIRVDVRIIAATRRDLDREVLMGRFRDDLFHRLAVTRIELPPLRARKGDVRVLVEHFCRSEGVDFDTLPEEVLAHWEKSPWPGNIRELRNAVSRWAALGETAWPAPSPEGAIADGDAGSSPQDFIDSVLSLGLPLTQARQRVVDAFEKRYVAHVLSAEGGHVGRAAAAAGIGRRYFQMLLARER